jgi:hypothetical protein
MDSGYEEDVSAALAIVLKTHCVVSSFYERDIFAGLESGETKPDLSAPSKVERSAT